MQTQPAAEAVAPRQLWTAPLVQDLPRLTELTLQTGPGGGGFLEDCGTGGSGSTCF